MEKRTPNLHLTEKERTRLYYLWGLTEATFDFWNRIAEEYYVTSPEYRRAEKKATETKQKLDEFARGVLSARGLDPKEYVISPAEGLIRPRSVRQGG